MWFERLERREKDRRLDAVTVSCKESCEGSIGNWPESVHAPGAPVISSAVVRDDARQRGGEAIVASLFSLLEEYSCNGHAGIALLRQFSFDPAQPEGRPHNFRSESYHFWFQASEELFEALDISTSVPNM